MIIASEFRIDASEIVTRVPQLRANLVEVCHDIVQRGMFGARAYAKDKAPWTDRTGNARQSIEIEDLSEGLVIKFSLYIGVTYGQYLELSNQGKYRILGPTMDIYGQQIKDDLAGMVR